MEGSSRRRVLAVLTSLSLFFIGTLIAGTAGEHTHRGYHDKSAEIPAGHPVPQVQLRVVPDPMSGWNVIVDVRNFRFAPERASLEASMGEGHANLYVDGEKVARVYGPAFHLPRLEPGTHTVTYSLNGNDHAPYNHRGKPIADSVVIDVPLQQTHAGKRHGTALTR